MAVYKIFPEKDSFIYTEQPTANAGKDEILEVGGYRNTSDISHTIRSLIQFPTSEIRSTVDNVIGSNDYSASIKMYLAEAGELPIDYTIYGYPIYTTAAQWDNGKGKYGDIPIDKSGVSWKYIQALETNAWPTAFPVGVTGSYQVGTPGGGNWYTSSLGESLISSHSHDITSTHDLELNVTTAIKQMYTGSIPNKGFIIKLQDDLEYNVTSSIRLKYFSGDTNTIYPPCLEFKWDDSSYVTGSLSVLATDIATINVKNNKGKYPDVGKQRFRLNVRPKYPTRLFTTSSVYLTNYALPSGSYWGLKDENTEEMVIDFDNKFTKISCDSNGAYFDVHMSGLQPERYYRLLIKSTLDGTTAIVSSDNLFKVVRNG